MVSIKPGARHPAELIDAAGSGSDSARHQQMR
jgi:hypothetical protein